METSLISNALLAESEKRQGKGRKGREEMGDKKIEAKQPLPQTAGFIFNNILPGCDYHQTSDRTLFELFRAICTVIICLLILLLETLIQKSFASLPWSCFLQGYR